MNDSNKPANVRETAQQAIRQNKPKNQGRQFALWFGALILGGILGWMGIHPNNAPMVAPILSSTLTDALRDKFTRQTRLTQVDEGGDFAFEGEITGYTSTTASVSGSSETALLNRLTITVNVRFTNAVDESMSWKKTFSAFEDFDSSKLLNEIEGELIPQIVDKLVTDIFQASAANW